MRNRKFDPSTLVKGKKYAATQEEIDQIIEEARQSQILLNLPYVMSYIEQAKKEILEMHARQSVYDVEEEQDVAGQKRIIKFPAVKEYQMLAGEYRFMDRFINDLQHNVELGKIVEEKLKTGEVEVRNDES